MTRRIRKRISQVFASLILLVCLGAFLFYRALQPVGGVAGSHQYLRIDHATPRVEVLAEAEKRGLIRSAKALDLLGQFSGRGANVGVGTYRLSPVESGIRSLRNLYHPIVQMVRLPETNWSKRNANLLQKAEVTTADEYLAEVNHPQGRKTDFPLPETTLEGYLYPDTYDFPPMMGAKAVVGRQLEAFRKKVWEPLNHPKDLERILTVASLVELEAGTDEDRPMIAGVIENRLKKGMKLQIDAALLYGIGKWRRLTFKDYTSLETPYNLYLHKGLPPTPICSPSIASIRAAMAPAHHNDLYYVALPNGTSLFAATYPEHKKNIEKRKAALKEREERKKAGVKP